MVGISVNGFFYYFWNFPKLNDWQFHSKISGFWLSLHTVITLCICWSRCVHAILHQLMKYIHCKSNRTIQKRHKYYLVVVIGFWLALEQDEFRSFVQEADWDPIAWQYLRFFEISVIANSLIWFELMIDSSKTFIHHDNGDRKCCRFIKTDSKQFARIRVFNLKYLLFECS